MEEDSFEDEHPEAETTAEEKSEDEYLKTEKAEASKFWDFKHEKDLFPDSIAEEEEMVEYDEEKGRLLRILQQQQLNYFIWLMTTNLKQILKVGCRSRH
ncbi:hypothetical protein COP2_016618 [Malus domestica]